MWIEYVVALPCVPKEQFGEDGVRHRLRLLAPRGVSASVGPEAPTEVVEAGFDLRPLAFHCAGCPANHAQRDFGCYGAVALPLSGEAEEWLVDLLPRSLKPPRGEEPGQPGRHVSFVQQLLDLLDDLGIDGLLAEEEYRDTYLLDRSRPALRKYGSGLRKTRLSSSQILELLLFREEIQPEWIEVACQALGVWEEGGFGEDGVPEVVFTEPIEERDDPSVANLKRLLYAMIVAASLDVPVRTHQAGAPVGEDAAGVESSPGG